MALVPAVSSEPLPGGAPPLAARAAAQTAEEERFPRLMERHAAGRPGSAGARKQESTRRRRAAGASAPMIYRLLLNAGARNEPVSGA